MADEDEKDVPLLYISEQEENYPDDFKPKIVVLKPQKKPFVILRVV